MTVAFDLTTADLARALTSIGLQQQLVAKAEHRADEIELAAELSGTPVSTVLIASDDGVSIRVTPAGETMVFEDIDNSGGAS